jgi:hypothetical protein
MPPNRFTPDAVRDEAPPREDTSASYQIRKVPSQQGARRLVSPSTPESRGETISFDVSPKGSSWEALDSFAIRVKKTD